MAWMTVEAAAAIAAGVIASIALVGFGLDSVIEFFAAVVVWQRRERGPREARSPPDRRHLLRPGRVPGRREHPRSHQPG